MKYSIIYAAAALSIVSACKQQEAKQETSTAPTQLEMTSVVSLQPSVQTVLPGELKPWNKANLNAKVKGYVGKVLVDRGSIVKRGQVLAVLEAPEIVASLNRARAQASSAEAAQIEHRARLKATKATWLRIVETGKTPGAVSANELDVAYAKMMSDSALFAAGEENLKAAHAQLAAEEQLVDYLSVRAPFDGAITERNVSPGELVGPDGHGKPLFIIEDQSRLRLTVPVPENLSNAINSKSVVQFTVEADPMKVYEAQFARSANSLAEVNRTMMTEFDVDNSNAALKPGMYAEVKLPVSRSKPTLFVPRSSLLQSTEGVFVVKVNNNIAEWVAVQRGNVIDSLVEVFGPVREGDLVVKQAFDELRNGQAVNN